MSWLDSEPASAGAGNPGQTLPQRAKRISSSQWEPPSFEMSMARKDLRLMVGEAAHGGQTLAMVPALAALLDEGIAPGEGHLDVAAGVRVPSEDCRTAGVRA
jgi:3-hydroxyisobutyrate dehydrogenase